MKNLILSKIWKRPDRRRSTEITLRKYNCISNALYSTVRMIQNEQISTVVQSKIDGHDGVELYFIIIVTITYYYRLPLYLVFLFFWHEFTDRDTSVKSTERARTKLQRFRVVLDTSSGSKIGRATNIPTTAETIEIARTRRTQKSASSKVDAKAGI